MPRVPRCRMAPLKRLFLEILLKKTSEPSCPLKIIILAFLNAPFFLLQMHTISTIQAQRLQISIPAAFVFARARDFDDSGAKFPNFLAEAMFFVASARYFDDSGADAPEGLQCFFLALDPFGVGCAPLALDLPFWRWIFAIMQAWH